MNDLFGLITYLATIQIHSYFCIPLLLLLLLSTLLLLHMGFPVFCILCSQENVQ